MFSRYFRGLSVLAWIAIAALAASAAMAESVDLVVRDGVIYDGSGSPPVRGDVAVRNGRVVASGRLSGYTGTQEVNARGLAVAPGFINMLSWATESLLHDAAA